MPPANLPSDDIPSTTEATGRPIMLSIPNFSGVTPHLPGVAESDITSPEFRPYSDFRVRTRLGPLPNLNRSHRHNPTSTYGARGRIDSSRPRRSARDDSSRGHLARPGERQSNSNLAAAPARAPATVPTQAPSPASGPQEPSVMPNENAAAPSRDVPSINNDERNFYPFNYFEDDGVGRLDYLHDPQYLVALTSVPVRAPDSHRVSGRPIPIWAISSTDGAEPADAALFRHRIRGATIPLAGRSQSSHHLPAASKQVEKAIEYLSKVRVCQSTNESLDLALVLGFREDDQWCLIFEQQRWFDDLLVDTSFLRVAPTSWLEKGGVFWGTQVAPSPSAASPRSSISSPSFSVPLRAITVSQWSVKLSISSTDYDQLSLTGTMEAFTDGKTNIKTYFEGEIIDFNRHSFHTLNYKSTLMDDANNWRKLEPFVSLNNSQLVNSLTSIKFMKELNENWLFLRIKELDFISPDPQPEVGSLTIGGFYYLSLHRQDGRIQGYYYDPQSQPFQELRLKPERRQFPSFQFR